jgi:hypothetical protein
VIYWRSYFENELSKYVRECLIELDLGKRASYHNVLSDEKRIGILKLLEFREMYVCELTVARCVTQPNQTHQIKNLDQ